MTRGYEHRTGDEKKEISVRGSQLLLTKLPASTSSKLHANMTSRHADAGNISAKHSTKLTLLYVAIPTD
jgi:hypothetical protein